MHKNTQEHSCVFIWLQKLFSYHNIYHDEYRHRDVRKYRDVIFKCYRPALIITMIIWSLLILNMSRGRMKRKSFLWPRPQARLAYRKWHEHEKAKSFRLCFWSEYSLSSIKYSSEHNTDFFLNGKKITSDLTWRPRNPSSPSWEQEPRPAVIT